MFPVLSANGPSGYTIANSLRFQAASSQYANRTFTTPTNNKIWTWAGWVKRGTLTAYQTLLSAGAPSVGNAFRLWFDSSDRLGLDLYGNGGPFTTAVYRDPSAWYHVVVSLDTTQTAANILKIYINNVLQATTNIGYTLVQNTNYAINSAQAHNIGRDISLSNNYFDGYIAEQYFIDGQALTPSSFGSTDATSGQWVAAKYTGTYGTNGFYLPFSNGTSTTTLGADSSGNSNNWTLTNFTRSAGVSDCWMYDVPSGNGGASGTQPNSNYCVMNPVKKNSAVSITNANLNVAGSNAYPSFGSIAMDETNGYYAEFYVVSVDGGIGPVLGVVDLSINENTLADIGSTKGVQIGATGTVRKDGTTGLTGLGTYGAGSIVMIAYQAGKVWAGVNGTWWNSGNPAAGTGNISTTSTPISGYTYGSNAYNSAQMIANFGQRSFAYTPPTGYKALCTANLPVATIKQGNKYMDATLYTGNGTGQSVTNAATFKPDLVWAKSRSSGSQWNILVDSVRGAGTVLFSNSSAADQSYPTSITAFNSNGFTVGVDVTGGWNVSGSTMVGWQWQAGQGSTSSNTNGSITSTTSVNATAGFSIVTYSTTGAGTVGHGLGVAPKMIIRKCRNFADDWQVYHASLPSAAYYLSLDLSNAQTSNSTIWNSTAPTSSVFSVGSSVGTANYVSYCFAEIAGFSKFGSYVANGSTDGPFCYTGFQPKFLLLKGSTSAGGTGWYILDSARNTYDVLGNYLSPNNSNAESSLAIVDFLSNGFKLRTTNSEFNASGQTWIYAAFATNPFQNSNAF